MQYKEQKQAPLWGISFLASLLIHVLLILLFYLMAPELKLQFGPPGPQPSRELRVYRAAPEEKGEQAADRKEQSQNQDKEKAEEEKPQFVKTSAESPEETPEEPDYIGERDTRISGDEKDKGEISEDDAPSLDGEDKEEINTVEQERQDGALEFDGKKASQGQQPSQQVAPPIPPTPPSAPSEAQQVTQPSESTAITPPTPPAPPAPPAQPTPPSPPTQASTPSPNTQTTPTQEQSPPQEQPQDQAEQAQDRQDQETSEHQEDSQDPQQSEQSKQSEQSEKSQQEDKPGHELEEERELEETPDGAVQLPQQQSSNTKITLPTLPSLPSSTSMPSPPPSTPSLPRPASAYKPVYDPMFTSTAQPGFRPNEKRNRSTGRFIIGRNAALNVASTPLGKYQELIYRRIASMWYGMLDEKSSENIPGSLTIQILINHKGQIPSIRLISRQGASISQQSITFDAIRAASIPPMPVAVQKEIVGDKLDFTITFYFD